MVVKNAVYFVLIFKFLQIVNGISNKEEQIIDEKFHRAAETSNNVDQSKTDKLKRDLFFTGHNPKYQHSGYGAPIGLDSSTGYYQGYYPSQNIRPNFAHGYDEEDPNYGRFPSGGDGLTYGHSGGGVGLYGHSSGGGIGLQGYNGGGGVGLYGHSGGGGFPYGHSGGGETYPHFEGGHSYEHGGGYGISGIGQYLQKKLSLKKIILPLAGIALIAAAGALSTTNPILLQLGTISSASARGKRSVTKYDVFPMNPLVKPKV